MKSGGGTGPVKPGNLRRKVPNPAVDDRQMRMNTLGCLAERFWLADKNRSVFHASKKEVIEWRG